ncbi:MAG: hypothetical protein IJ593_00860 [Lachnospiraceae bacterium]|nr:hypothetical protein [Lachnospiraceae bacterium]
MEREVSDVVKLSATLILIAAVITLVWLTVAVGNTVKSDSYIEASSVETAIENSQLNSLKYKTDLIIPKAAIYNLLYQEEQNIVQVKYDKVVYTFKNDLWVASDNSKSYRFIQDIISSGLSGKAALNVHQNSSGTYEVIIDSIK